MNVTSFSSISYYRNLRLISEIDLVRNFQSKVLLGKLHRLLEVSQNPQIKVPYPPTNGGQQRLGTLVAFVRPSVT